MSGLVAIVSRDPAALDRGDAALAYLRHLDGDTATDVHAARAWAGTCGRADLHACDLATAGDGRSLAIAVAGEVANGAELRATLGLGRASSAIDLVAAAYERWGERLFFELEGAYALVVHDAARSLTLAGVDALGVATLFATTVGDDVLFASEAKAFFADPRFTARRDETGWASLLTQGHAFADRTLFDGVRGLREGTHFAVADGRLTTARHWDPRDDVPQATGRSLRGDAYLESQYAAILGLTAEACRGTSVVLPLTGGLDSRGLAAAAPFAAPLSTMTFGTGHDDDSRLAARIAGARGIPHQTVPLADDYLPRHAADTVWMSEGQVNPALNITGFLMPGLAAHDAFVTGIGGEFGRLFLKGHNLIPDRRLLEAPDERFEERMLDNVLPFGVPADHQEQVFGERAAGMAALGRDEQRAAVATTRGLTPVDRLDLYGACERMRRYHQAGVTLAGMWLAPRAPYLTRRWIQTVLGGAPDERIDDLVRLRLVRRLDARVALVPWTLTRLPLPACEAMVLAMRRVSRRRAPAARGGATGTPTQARGAAGRAARWAKQRVYSHGERHDEWLRTVARPFVESVLFDERTLDRGLTRREGLRALWDEHLAGADRSMAIGHLLTLELWQRQFVDERPRPRPLGGAD